MKRIITISFFAVFSFGSMAQKDKQTVMITSMEEKPEDLRFLTLELPIWHLTGSMVNFSLYDAKGTFAYNGSGKLNGGLSYNLKLGDRILPETYERTDYVYQNMIMSKFNAPSAQSLDVYGTYFFKDEMKKVTETITLKRVGNVIYVTNVETDEYTRMGLTLGYNQGFTWYNMNNMDIVLVDPNTNTNQTFNYSSMSTVQTHKMIKAGITISKAVNLKVNVEEYGTRTSAHLKTNTFSLIYAIQNDFDDVLVGVPNTSSNEIQFLEYAFSDENARLPIGFEYKHKEHPKGWLSYEYGVGYYPGLMKKINIGVHFGISLQIDMLKNHSL
jgi:hypothetical protein